MDAVLWVLLIVAIVGVVLFQVLSAKSASGLEGPSAKWVVGLRVLNAIVLFAVLVWIVYVQLR